MPVERAHNPCHDCYAEGGGTSIKKVLGKVWPNLVFIHDSGKKCVEFRMQCEVLLPVDVARELEEVFLPGGNSATSWEEAREKLLCHVHPDAEEFFVEVLRNAIRQGGPTRASRSSG